MNKPYNLFLDDFREPEEAFNYSLNQVYLLGWEIVRDYDEFVKKINECGLPEIVSFDHDLADAHYEVHLPYDQYKEKTGYHCAQYLIEYCIANKLSLPKTILIHSMNFGGTQNIKSLFTSYYKVYPDKFNGNIASFL